MEAEQKEELLELFDQAREVGNQERLADLLGLERHRLSHWRTRRDEGFLEDGLQVLDRRLIDCFLRSEKPS